ncbi:MAG: DUF3817 domain-containing protein [Canibacter sp.]
MVLKPRPETFPKIRRNLKLFTIASIITGIMLFGLYVVAGIRWGMNSDIWLFTENGIAQLVQLPPEGIELDFTPENGFNFTVIFLIVHGWFYVVYLLAAFALWSPMRWPFWRFLVIAIAGTLIIVSFIVEWWVVRDVKRTLSEADSAGTESAPRQASTTE